MDDSEIIQERKERIARKHAQIDQFQKQFEEQYPMIHPVGNLFRYNDLEVMRFRVEILEWELEGLIATIEDEKGEEPE